MGAALGIFVASLLGSAHCAAMCGPFVAFYSGAAAEPGGRARWGAHVAYNAGRLSSYALLGAVAGSLGAGLDRAGRMAGVGRLAAVVAGMLMVAWGVSTILAVRGVRVPWLHAPPALQRQVSAALARFRAQGPVLRGAAMGLLTGFLPCGWLYAFVAAAGGTGSPLRGAAVMALFWAGTLPVLASLGLGLQRLAGPLRARLPIVTAAAVVAIGLLSITGRLRPHPMRGPAAPARTSHGDHR